MNDNFRYSDGFQHLREKAGLILKEKDGEAPDIDKKDLERLAHELEVSYVELEVQNEELRRTRREVQRSRDEFFDLYESAPVAYITLNHKGVVERANKAVYQMLKGSGKFLLGSPLSPWVHKEDLSLYFSFMETLARAKKAGPADVRLLGKNDETVYVQMEATANINRKNDLWLWRLTLIDITKRKQMEIALQREKEHLRLCVEGANLGTWEIDLIADRISWNRILYDLLGRDLSRPVTKETFFKYLHKDDLMRVRENMERTYRDQTEFIDEFRITREDGQLRWLAAFGRVYCDRMGQPIRTAGVNFDVTDRKNMEETLRQSHEVLERRVQERTRNLEETNKALKEEMNKRIRFENDLRESSKKILLESKQRRFLSARLVEMLERDRRDVAMYLHDQIGQALTTLKMDLETFRNGHKEINGQLIEKLSKAENMIMGIMGDVREVSRKLRPDILDTLGLIPALRSLVESFRKQLGTQIHFYYRDVSQKIDIEKSLAVYRILQETLNNIGKHAQANEIFVNLIPKEHSLHLSVEDDGVGFNYDQLMSHTDSTDKGPLGIMIMKDRAFHAEGQLHVESEIGKGTRVFAEIPFQ